MAQTVKKLPTTNAGDRRDTGSTPLLVRSPGDGNSNPPQYSCLENSMDRGPWWATSPCSRKELDMTERLTQQQQQALD